MDDQGRQGELVRLFANERKKITCDPEMQREIDKYMSAGRASFSVLLQVGGRKDEYTDVDIVGVREKWSTFVSNFIFR
ncbi:hypothetical protein L1987_23246 [Smallanthus sonchifolius]|uniref:Uncharacterized protein n=1 Tax=Smallanthus sonchifolius TaxID=185202 RepID=A0ACB9IIV4_9ASTR|nr:hypothetical protein L1987_23246 [Smallanthus sonchifolius]